MVLVGGWGGGATMMHTGSSSLFHSMQTSFPKFQLNQETSYIGGRLPPRPPASYANPFQLTWNIVGKKRNSKSNYRLTTHSLYKTSISKHLLFRSICVVSASLSLHVLIIHVPSELKRVHFLCILQSLCRCHVFPPLPL